MMKQIFGPTIIKQLKKTFDQQKQVLAIYAFGSQVKGYAAKKSDLDLAVFVKNRKQISERDILKLLMQSKIKIPFEIDLVVVDFDSPPLLLFQIVKDGICLYYKDILRKIDLEAKAMHFYYDNQHMRNIYSDYLNKSFKEGTYGYK